MDVDQQPDPGHERVVVTRFPSGTTLRADVDPARTYVSTEDPEYFWREVLRWQL